MYFFKDFIQSWVVERETPLGGADAMVVWCYNSHGAEWQFMHSREDIAV